jgi:hypothetical protein
MQLVKVTPDDLKPDTKWILDQGLDTIGVVERWDWPASSKFADTPYELWTPSYRSGQPVPRFATLDEAVKAADEIAFERALGSMLKPVEVHRETYRSVEFVITRNPATAGKSASGLSSFRTFARYGLTYDGRGAQCPSGDLEAIVKKLRVLVDVQAADREMQPKLRTLIDARLSAKGMPGWDAGTAPKVGDVAYVYGHGRYRRGLVAAVTKTRATVAYVTASNPTAVHRKADKHAELVAG